MTSPAFFVISTALVFSAFGIVLDTTADYEPNEMADLQEVKPHWYHKFAQNTQVYKDIDEFKSKHDNINVNNYNTRVKHRKTMKPNKNSKIHNMKKYNTNEEEDKIYDDIDIDISKRNLELHRMKLRKDKLEKNNLINTKTKNDKTVTQYQNNNKNIVSPSKNEIDDLYNDIDVSQIKRHLYKKKPERDTSILEIEETRRYKRETENKCAAFEYDVIDKTVSHPHQSGQNNYYNNSNCVTKINASSPDQIIELTFVDMFHIEYHADCAYDFLEIRDGYYGYADLLGKFCGEAFPRTLTTKGPHAWLRFHSDDTIEYEGFKIVVNFKPGGASTYVIPDKCYITVSDAQAGEIKVNDTDPICRDETKPLDVLWTIETAENTKIYLNFTSYKLAKPNECNENKIQVFETVEQELDTELAEYCGSIANSITSNGNVVYVRLFASKTARSGLNFAVTYNQFRTVDNSKGDKCIKDKEFDCEDSTCIDINLYCDKTAHCRLKADEESCDPKASSTLTETHILVILVIFSLILSGMSFVFLYKCIRKLYQDHKIIKEHIRQSCEDSDLLGSRLILEAKKLQRDSEPRASLERENHSNEIKRKYSKSKQPSIDSSDYIQETALDLDEEWKREDVPIAAQDIRIERNGRRSDFSKKEESLRRRDSEKEKREIRDVSVGAPDTKESGCQTRESLFQAEPAASSDGSGSNSRGFSTFGYSGATIARPSPPTNTSEVTIELLKQVPPQETKPTKKLPDRRPISTETTRSAPDVIIVSKPIR